MAYIGTDIVEVDRITRAIENGKINFLERVFSEKEINAINLNEPNYERASGFWAAKEAIVKATGLGFSNGIRFQNIEICHDHYGCPYYVLTGRLKEILTEKGIAKISLSISHCRTYAIAVAILS
ncbi:holo-ACP synthase [Kosakonia sp. H02]|nr:holo-ACP synthase [Kosakonia sp. H02]